MISRACNKNKKQCSRAASATPVYNRPTDNDWGYKMSPESSQNKQSPLKSSAVVDAIVPKRSSSAQLHLQRALSAREQRSSHRINNLDLEDIVKQLVLSGRTNNAEISSKVIHALNKTYIQSDNYFSQLRTRPITPRRIFKQYRASPAKKIDDNKSQNIKLFQQINEHIPCFPFPQRKIHAVNKWIKKDQHWNQQTSVASAIFDSPLFKSMTEQHNNKHFNQRSKPNIKKYHASSEEQSLPQSDINQSFLKCSKANIYS